MNIKYFFPFLFILIWACKSNKESIHPKKENITESIYASGLLKSKDQYRIFPTVSGLIEEIYVTEGDSIKKGQRILTIANETTKINKQNAELAAEYADYNNNLSKLNELKLSIELAKNKLEEDSLLLIRQQTLFSKGVGSKFELEQKELSFKNSKTSFESAKYRYSDLERQLKFSSGQSKKNLLISSKQENDYTIRSEIEGVIYSLDKTKGELVSPQTSLGVIGDAQTFILEMQVDEFDILKIKTGQQAIITMDAYKGQLFEAKITKINPLMNERTKSFLVEAMFVNPPIKIYPNITFEANIVIDEKQQTLTIPRNYLLNDTTVVNIHSEKITIRTGLKDYKIIEVISGLTEADELIKPIE